MADPEEKNDSRRAINSKGKTSKPKTEYLDTLDSASKRRYLGKIKLINNIDPYKIDKKDWSKDEDNLPAINYPDLIPCLLFTPSPFSKEELKAIKSTEAYNQFLEGWVHQIFTYQLGPSENSTQAAAYANRSNESTDKPCVMTCRVRISTETVLDIKIDDT